MNPRRDFLPVLVCALILGGPAWRLAPAMENDLPYDLQQRLEAPLQDNVKELLRERNDLGNPYKRGSFSRSFHKIDDNTYQVSMHVDTAEDGRMTTERFLYTLKLNPANLTWEITAKALQDSYTRLHRRNPGDEEIRQFDSFQLNLEGLTITAAAGSMIIDMANDQPEFIFLSGDDLTYDYTPASKQADILYSLLKKEKEADFVFTADRVGIFCDPRSCTDIIESSFTGLRPTTKEDLSGVLKGAYKEYVATLEENRHENGFSGFRMPFNEDHTMMSITLKRAGVDHYLGLSYDSYEPEEVTFWVSDYGRLFSYYGQETRESGLSAYDLEQRPDLENREYDLVAIKGTVEMGVQEPGRLQADVTYSMTTRLPVKELGFGLAALSDSRSARSEAKDPRMTINSFQDDQGNELLWMKTGATSGYVVFPEVVPAGTELTLRIQFINDDAIFRLTPSYAYLARSGWLPFVSFSDKIDTIDLTVLSPAKYTPLAVGHIVEESKEGRIYRTRWQANSPVTFPTVIYGDYVVSEPGFDAKRANGDKIPVTIHVDRDNLRDWQIRPKQLRPLADDAANALNLYREIYGVDYPYERLDLVNDWATLRGQAPASLIYLGSASFRGQGAFADASATIFVKSLVAHEVGHQWWGSLITNANTRNYWFVESLAEYSAALFVEVRYGPKAYENHVAAWRKEILEADLRASVQDAPILWSGRNAGYRAAVYAQGPYMFHIMRNTFGDEKFFAFLKAMAQSLQGKEIVTRDIQKEAEKAFNVNMEDFFDQWVRGVGLPEYTVNYETRRLEDGAYMVEGTIDQRVLLGPAKEVMPDTYYLAVIRMTIGGKKGKAYAKTLVVDGPATEFKLKVPEQPQSVKINEQGEVLAYDVIMNGAG